MLFYLGEEMFGMCIVGGSRLHGLRDTLVLCSDLLTRERIFVQPSPRALTTRNIREYINLFRIVFCDAIFIRCETTSKHCDAIYLCLQAHAQCKCYGKRVHLQYKRRRATKKASVLIITKRCSVTHRCICTHSCDIDCDN